MLLAGPSLAALLLCASGVVRAQGVVDMGMEDMSDEQARAHFSVGKTLYDAGRFREAAEEWEKAYALSKKDALLYNVYVARRDASDVPMAIDALRRYLATTAPTPEERINLQARLRAMEEAQRQAEPAPAAPAAAAPAAAEPAAPADAGGDKDGEGDSAPSVLPYVLIGVGGALVVGGVVTGLIANGQVSDIEDQCPNDRCVPGYDLESARDDAQLVVTLTDVLLAGGIVVGGVGAVLLFIGGEDEHARGPSPTLACGPGACIARVSGAF
jgi:tetratricopeptide (TPR) repeat protein